VTPYYQDNLVTLYHGDALEVLPTIDEIGLVVTDPPYFQPATHYVPTRADSRPVRSLGDTSVLEHAFRAWAAELDRVTTDEGSLYVFCDGQSYPLFFRALYGLGRVRPLIWDKANG
jgi:DNA modification methylase